MAEVLGVVAGSAGLAQLAAQLFHSCLKMRQLYESYKEAPTFLEDTFGDLDSLALILHTAERDRQARNDVDQAIVQLCVSSCERAAKRMQAVVDKLELAMQRSIVKGRVFTMFNQNKLEELSNELANAKISLMLALQVYKASCQDKDVARIISTIDNNTTILRQYGAVAAGLPFASSTTSKLETGIGREPSDSLEVRSSGKHLQHARNRGRRADKRKSSTQSWTIRLSPWFTRRVWEVELRAAQSGFDLNLRTCNFISPQSLIFETCRYGDVVEVQALFQTGKASPYDCSTGPLGDGMTVLSEAARSGNAQLCRYLVDIAGFPVRPNRSQDPLEIYWAGRWQGAQEAVEMYRVLVKDPHWAAEDLVTGNKYSAPLWWCFAPYPLGFKLATGELSVPFSELPWEDQFDRAMKRARLNTDDVPETFLAILGAHDGVTTKIAKARDNDGRTCLHLVANSITRKHFADRLRSAESDHAGMIDFVRQLLACGADIHHRDKWGQTPLMVLAPSRPFITGNVRMWLELLVAAGVNLEDYGRVESVLWAASSRGEKKGYVRLPKWTYGPKVQDWTFEPEKSVFYIPIYELVGAPGAYDEPSNRTICWHPEEFDIPEGPWHWRNVRQVMMHCNRSTTLAVRFGNPLYKDQAEVYRVQDDCGLVIRLFEKGYRPGLRPRSFSQPHVLAHHFVHPRRQWLPVVYNCLCVGPSLVPSYSPRKCLRRSPASELGHRNDSYAAIRRQMEHFRSRYNSRAELRSLPYAAYHPVWKRNWSLAPKQAAFKEL